jgi:transposase-like protein
MSRQRRNCTAEQKADVVRRHLKDKVAISQLATEMGIQPKLMEESVKAKKDNGDL